MNEEELLEEWEWEWKFSGAKETYKEYRRKHQQTYQKARQRQLKADAIEHYGGACLCCGETTLQFLTLAHTIHIKEPIHQWLRRYGWPDVAEVYCHNCKAAIDLDGSCPHSP